MAVQLISLNGENGIRLDGVSANERSGLSVAGAGDFNDDGIEDVLIGGPGSGDVYVVFGMRDALPTSLDLSALDGSNGFRVDAVAGEDSGRSVSAAGDVNGDGITDFIIGAPRSNAGDSGAAYVVFGQSGGSPAIIGISGLAGVNGFRIDGEADNDYAGTTVSEIGDFNGDGIDDILIGAPGADPSGNASAGATYVVFGSTAGFSPSLNLSELNGANGFVLNGVDAGDVSGGAVSGAGDINGDGLDDIIIGAPSADAGGDNSGESYVVFGRSSALPAEFNLADLNGANGFTIIGADRNDYSGSSVSFAGDFNGDRIDDLIIGAPGGDGGGLNSGESFVVFGKRSAFAATLDLGNLNGSNGVVINGASGGDQSGRSVSTAFDVNRDGADDIIIGAPGGDPGNRSGAGEAFVVFGGQPSTPVINLSTLTERSGFVINGVTASDSTGQSVAAAGDFNGDGTDDIIVGAPLADPSGENNAGESFIVFGVPTVLRRFPDGNTILLTRNDGTAGRDVINGTADNELINLSFGNDTGRGGNGRDQITGGFGNDTIDGGIGGDFLLGGRGNDLILGRGGTDVLRGDTGNDIIFGGNNADIIDGGSGSDLLGGGNAPDSVLGGSGNDRLFGDAGNDTLSGGTGNDTMRGASGNDVQTGGTGNDFISGGSGDDRQSGNQGRDQIFGDSGDDLLFGGTGNDRIFGGAGKDILRGENDQDVLSGGNGNDSLFGDNGNDILRGDAGNDFMRGGEGRDFLNGGRDSDSLFGGNGIDTLNGGQGDDFLSPGPLDEFPDIIIVDRFTGDDTLVGFEDGLDRINVSGSVIKSAADLEDRISNDGRFSSLIDLGGGSSLRVANIRPDQLDPSDFIF